MLLHPIWALSVRAAYIPPNWDCIETHHDAQHTHTHTKHTMCSRHSTFAQPNDVPCGQQFAALSLDQRNSCSTGTMIFFVSKVLCVSSASLLVVHIRLNSWRFHFCFLQVRPKWAFRWADAMARRARGLGSVTERLHNGGEIVYKRFMHFCVRLIQFGLVWTFLMRFDASLDGTRK